MTINNAKPRLRPFIQIEHGDYEGRKIVIFRDPSEVAPSPGIFHAELFPIIARFDGKHTIADIAKEGAPYGITEAFIVSLVGELEKLHLLETTQTELRWREIQETFRDTPVREEALAGVLYPNTAEALSKVIDKYIKDTKHHHQINDDFSSTIGFICPHIDYHRGWHAYGTAFSTMREIKRPDIIFLFGTAHQPGRGIFHLTKKPFRSPLGTFPTATEVVEEIGASYGHVRSFQDEILHKKEHSLELQLPFLAHRYRETSLPALVPVLVGSFHRCIENNRNPMEVGEISDFVNIVSRVVKTVRDSGKRILFYGGVDLAHVGLHFGDQTRASESRLEEIEKRDKEFLNAALAGDEDRLFLHVQEDGDQRRLCGFPSMFTMLATLRRAGIVVRGKLIEYRQAVEPKSDCVVTFASACWFEV